MMCHHGLRSCGTLALAGGRERCGRKEAAEAARGVPLRAAGIGNYDEAVDACDLVGRDVAAPGAVYSLEDLSAFVCLSQHKEVTAAKQVPEPPPPVTAFGELCLGDPRDPGFHASIGAQGYATRITRKRSPPLSAFVSVIAGSVAEAFVLSSSHPHSRRYSFVAPLPALVLDVKIA